MRDTVIVTGAAGLLGSQLVKWLVSNTDVDIIGVDDLSGGLESNWYFATRELKRASRWVELVVMDVAGDEFSQLVSNWKPKYIFHFAAYAAECLSPFIRKYNYQNNLIATSNVINAAINNNVKRVIFTSSMAVYGRNTPPFSEDMMRQPIDPYGVAKAACEMDLEIAHEQHGLDYCIIRPHNVYGPGQNIFDPYRNVIGIFMYKTLVGDPITIYGDGLQQRAFSYIDDSLEPLWNSAILPEAGGQIINLGGIHEVSIKEMAEEVKKQAGILGIESPEIIYLPPRHEVRQAYSTFNKSSEILGFQHETNLSEGIAKMWEWILKCYPNTDAYKRKIWTEYEVEKGLYPYWKADALKDGYWKGTKI